MNDAAHLDRHFAFQYGPAARGQLEPTMRVVVDASEAERDELTKQPTPLRIVEIRANPEHAKTVVLPLQDALGLSAAQDVDQVHGAEALPRAVDGRQRLARSVGGVPRFRRIDAGVAVAAGSARFAEIIEQPNAAAPRGLA